MILQMARVDADGGRCVPTSPRWRFEYSGWAREVGGCVPTSPRWGGGCSGWVREMGRCVPTSPRWGVGCSGWAREVGRCVPTGPQGDFECSGWAREVGRCEATEGGDQRTSTRVAATAPTGPWTPRVRKATSVRRRRLKRVVVAKRADKPRPTGSFISPCTR